MFSSGDVSGESSELEENRLPKDLPSQMSTDRDQLLSKQAALTSRVGAHAQTSHVISLGLWTSSSSGNLTDAVNH